MRRTTWILWLMLALLPLRSWAVAGMGMPQLQPVTAVASQIAAHPLVNGDASSHSTAAQPACHQASSDAGSSSPCQACDWCHAAMGLAPRIAVIGSPPPSCAPPPAIARDTGRPSVNGLDRPPRHLVA